MRRMKAKTPASQRKKKRERRSREPHPHALCYSVSDAASILGVSPRTLWTMILEREIESRKIRSRRVVTRAALEAYLAQDADR